MRPISIKPGKYIVAVSGGVDSIVLLDLLGNLPGLDLVVAHFDHGIRPESSRDLDFVETRAYSYGFRFVSEEGNLGPKASEASAREARYNFLTSQLKAFGAEAIITAHHQDDLIETAIINLLRGTGRKGLSSLTDSEKLKRPLLEIPKSDLISYAKKNNLEWREDQTNNDEKYLRNYVRHNITARLSMVERQQLLSIIQKASRLNLQIDTLLTDINTGTGDSINRQWFLNLPHQVSAEVMLNWLKSHNIRQLNRRSIETIVISSKTLKPDKRVDIDSKFFLLIKQKHLALMSRDR